jgi:hypothetical protein
MDSPADRLAVTGAIIAPAKRPSTNAPMRAVDLKGATRSRKIVKIRQDQRTVNTIVGTES